MVEPYDFTVIDASQSIERIFRDLQRRMARLVGRGAVRPARAVVRKARV
jgi:hypothetical protein